MCGNVNVSVCLGTIVTLVVALLGMVSFTILLIRIVQPNNSQGLPVHGIIISLPLRRRCQPVARGQISLGFPDSLPVVLSLPGRRLAQLDYHGMAGTCKMPPRLGSGTTAGLIFMGEEVQGCLRSQEPSF